MLLEEARIGITPVLKRLAYAFLTRGFGRHCTDQMGYDEVVVGPLYPWKPEAEEDSDSKHAAGIRVEFYSKGRRLRWVEFGVRDIGGGGKPVVSSVK